MYEWARGGELYEFVALGALPENMVRFYFKQLIEGIEYMHNEDPENKLKKVVYHRDLKMENILLDEKLNLKIGDFGLSINEGKLEGSQTTDKYVGTPPHIPPEVHERKQYVPALFDIFSAGVILFSMY